MLFPRGPTVPVVLAFPTFLSLSVAAEFHTHMENLKVAALARVADQQNYLNITTTNSYVTLRTSQKI